MCDGPSGPGTRSERPDRRLMHLPRSEDGPRFRPSPHRRRPWWGLVRWPQMCVCPKCLRGVRVAQPVRPRRQAVCDQQRRMMVTQLMPPRAWPQTHAAGRRHLWLAGHLPRDRPVLPTGADQAGHTGWPPVLMPAELRGATWPSGTIRIPASDFGGPNPGRRRRGRFTFTHGLGRISPSPTAALEHCRREARHLRPTSSAPTSGQGADWTTGARR